jgi:hypothetical protein
MLMMTVLLGFAALSVDLGRFRTARSELETLADAAALNAANGLSDNTYAAKANAVAAENKVDNVVASIPAANVVPGYWSGTAFTANGLPRNAVRVTASRTKAAGNALSSYVASALGWSSPDLSATSTVALVTQTPYEWAATDSVNLTSTGSKLDVAAFDATSPSSAHTTTTLKSDGSVTLGGPVSVTGDVNYTTTTSINPAATVTGNITQNPTQSAYPPGSQVANLAGVTPTYSATTDMTVTTSMYVPAGTYVMKNFTVANCNIIFMGPVTIVATGNCTFNNVAVTTYNNLPTNLRLISTTPGSTINITNPASPMYADFYAPDSTLNLTSSSASEQLRGRGVFKVLNASGPGGSLWYDRSLNNSSMSKKPVLVR